MQKWRKTYLILMGILIFVTCFISAIAIKYHANQVFIFGKYNLIDFIVFIAVVVLILCLLLEVFGIIRSIRRFHNVKFQLKLESRKLQLFGLIFLFLNTIYIYTRYLKYSDVYILFLSFTVFVLALTQAIHYCIENKIGENGVLHWGIYHGWEDIISYYIEDDTVLEMTIICKVVGIKYNNIARFDIRKEDKDDIAVFLAEKLNKQEVD